MAEDWVDIMTEEHKKKLCHLAGFDEKFIQPETWVDYDLEILIKAMWAINRNNSGKTFCIIMSFLYVEVISQEIKYSQKTFDYRDYNSEQEALQAALLYILDNE